VSAPTDELETLWERIREAMRLAAISGEAMVTLEMRDAETLWIMAEQGAEP
jgi:hypothetical protein